MPCSLPPEVLDLIVDHLLDEPTALKGCCLVSKSWVPRTRKHLFANVEFHAEESHIKLWKDAFPDPSNSPAHHTRSLFIRGFAVFAADVGGWIHTFNRVNHLRLECLSNEDHRISLIPFHGLSPTLKSLRLNCSYPNVFDLICSFPLLEDLALVSSTYESDTGGWDTPSTSPKLTGSLDLRIPAGICAPARRLLGFPGGLHFTGITVGYRYEGIGSTSDLVLRCSDTLEYLSIAYCFPSTSPTSSIDLSKATKLKHVDFYCVKPNIRWITMALQTAKSKDLQHIEVNLYTALVGPIGETVQQEWLDLDRLLARFSTSHSIRPTITHNKGEGWVNLRNLAPTLLPELTTREAVDLVESVLYD